MSYSAVNRRRQRWRESPLLRALLLSLAVHLLFIAIVDTGVRLGLWQHASWLDSIKSAIRNPATQTTQERLRAQQEQAQQELPLLFVDVDPNQATEDAPKDTPYYSALNSRAANPDTSVDSNVPKISGQQTQVVKTMDTPRSQPQPLQPQAPPATPEATTKEVAAPLEPVKPKGGESAGNLASARPTLQPGPADGTAEREIEPKVVAAPPRPRPRRLAEVARSNIAGEKMQQEGGVRRFAVESSLSVRATPFGAYDAAIIAAIQHRWYALLDENEFARQRTGRVILDFHLNYDGRITEMKVADNSVGELLSAICQRAVLDPSPFAPWPSDMRRLVGANHREVRFTFFYN